MLIALEVIVQNQFSIGPRKDKIDPGSLEIPVEEQLSVADDNRTGRRLGGVNRLYVGLAARIRANAVSGYRSVKFTRVIQGLPDT